MLVKSGYAFLVLALFCIVVKTSAIAPLLVGVTLVAYGKWRENAYVPHKRNTL